MGVEFGGEWIHVYVWLNPFAVHLKLSQLALVLTGFSVAVCSAVSDSFGSPWTVARQAPLSVGFPRQEYWWVAISFSREASRPRDQTHISCVSCTGRRILYYCAIWEAPNNRLCGSRSVMSSSL